MNTDLAATRQGIQALIAQASVDAGGLLAEVGTVDDPPEWLHGVCAHEPKVIQQTPIVALCYLSHTRERTELGGGIERISRWRITVYADWQADAMQAENDVQRIWDMIGPLFVEHAALEDQGPEDTWQTDLEPGSLPPYALIDGHWYRVADGTLAVTEYITSSITN